MSNRLSETERLIRIVHELRTKCPWDRKQTHRTLVPYLLEEAHEVVDAIEKRNRRELEEELGDVLLQVALHAEIASETGRFTFERVAKNIADKMIRRHPHIYTTAKYKDEKTHLKNWTESKRKENPKKGRLDGLPVSLPGLQLARRYGEVAGSIGFDWQTVGQVEKKVFEEWKELRAETSRRSPKKARIEEELGDLLFTISNLARHLNIDAEQALRQANQKFRRRFERIEKALKKQGDRKLSLRELEALWQKAKL
ncbi:MAG: nucleoside triphosphate pyrophosphohydrolase [Deltaproteobacteria bacterium]|nr:nucleoside triphosphate pyrophosphohydrolase [Deltaproteobacteria bacterium]MBI3295051.1 nucleoside triphosphate pyrophosphohydrolase [Deltaproteobacteria bacterium]